MQAYQASGDAARPGWNVVPWDGVGLHPYWVDAGKFQQLVRVMAQKLRDRGDFRSQIWVTEIGMEAKPAPANAPPSDEEVKQADFLTAVYRTVLDDPQPSPVSEMRPDVTAAITKAVHAVHPGVPVVPYLESGGTDGKVYRAEGIPTFATSGIFMKPSDMYAHGLNERLPVKAFYEGVDHIYRLATDLGGR